MRVIIQKALESSVSIDGEVVGQIDKGFVLLVGFTHDDRTDDIEYCARKVANLRLFDDEEGKTNLSLDDVSGQILSVSQFTLYANTKKGNRPSFINACDPERATELYDQFNEALRGHGFQVETGRFGAYMEVRLINDGPMTIILDSKQRDL